MDMVTITRVKKSLCVFLWKVFSNYLQKRRRKLVRIIFNETNKNCDITSMIFWGIIAFTRQLVGLWPSFKGQTGCTTINIELLQEFNVENIFVDREGAACIIKALLLSDSGSLTIIWCQWSKRLHNSCLSIHRPASI